MPTPVLRLAYVGEFLLALVAIPALWSQVGGQGHLDLMPWYDKLVLIVALAMVTVLGTIAAVSQERAWNLTAIVCLIVALLLVSAMAGLTYYYHLHEDDDLEDAGTGVAALTCVEPTWTRLRAGCYEREVV